MKKSNEKGFTLIEMMIVLLVISVLLIITIPNITKNNSEINNKGCEAFIKMVQGQVQAYEIENNKLPQNIQDLVEEDYLNEGENSCPNGQPIIISNGKVVLGAAS
ncbi:competence type IV pilus major pilin ComGC [Cytobacillus purgationiresistens]|uniref:ComG operon protein 3 n=1 Tax=Cytobacillus purgationiresistens TaxID=863449 RepID=A0ABU0ADU8_9BACI|nr:competence type IV pilus major pilin ComGC [Cytobacillus purgationiresistens]MDQ0269426.1 competence protein ComGC [Cytobacillus purgationiresistens]